MALTYTELTTLVRTWCNRDEEVVSDSVIQDALQYAADKVYRTLRVPPLENVAVFVDTDSDLTNATVASTNINPSKTEIQIPQDLTEIIAIKETDSAGNTIRVFNEKLDIRTFNDPFAERYTNNNYFTRERNVLILSPGFGYSNLGTAANIEVYYYRRLPSLSAKYAVTELNYAAGLLTTSGGTTPLYFVNGNTTTAYETLTKAETADTGKVTAKVNVAVSNSTALTNDTRSGTVVNGMQISGTGISGIPTVSNASNQNSIVMSAAQTIADNVDLVFSNTNTANYIGIDVPHWLRDENERLLVYGALAQIYAFTQDDMQAAKFDKLFYSEIAELNSADKQRQSSGGNVQMNFNGRGMI